jgi:hypothetical protein
MNDPGSTTDGPTDDHAPQDPVLIRRERIRKLCDLGSRIGYSCFGLAVVLFVVAFIADFPSWIVTVIVASMAVGSITLLPAIVLGYGVKAADAEDRGEKFGY